MKKTLAFEIYNKSSTKMQEIPNKRVDLIATSPPYNIGTKYGNFNDALPWVEFAELLRHTFQSCYRILKHDGKLVVEVADSIFSQGLYVQLAGYIQAVCLSIGFKIIERHINFVNSSNGRELPEHSWSEDYITKSANHSNCHQILVLSKHGTDNLLVSGEVLYINYTSTIEHPCSMPPQMRKFILDRYFKEGMIVADPFMGTARMGKEVLKRRGQFIGYELDRVIYNTAASNLKNI